MAKKIEKKEVCRCENCGNEAEMVFTCTLEDAEQEKTEAKSPAGESHAHQVKGSATCTHCGNEAEMWIDY